MKVLVLAWTYPNHRQPLLGCFVHERTRALARRAEVRVVAPVRWFPLAGLFFPGRRPRVRAREEIDGIDVRHPRFFSVPFVLKTLEGFFCFLSVWATLRRVRRSFAFDVIDAHFVYPDGVAAALLGKALGVPFTITLRGLIRPFARRRVLRRQITWALRRAAATMSVSASLERTAIDLGRPPGTIRVVQNGVDARRFRPLPKAETRRELGLPEGGKVLISVGHMIELKGFHRVVRILPELISRHPDLLYVVVGGATSYGDFGPSLRREIARANLRDRVVLAGTQPPDRVVQWLSAADVFCLMTKTEGWANVSLEAMACGLPVVTTRVGGNAEVVTDDRLGTLVELGDSAGMVQALDHALDHPWDRDSIRAHAEANSWDAVADRILRVLESVGPRQDLMAV